MLVHPTTRALLALGVVLAAWGCTHRIPLPPRLAVSGTAELRERMVAARPTVQKYFAEARMTYFGPAGTRVKGSASLAVARPHSLRYDLIGPHGGVIEAFATNGTELQLLIAGENRFLHGPATPANVDRLLSFVPLRLDPEGWVGLLFGDIEVPPEAEVRYDEEQGLFAVTWQSGDATVRAGVDPETSRVMRAVMRRGDEVISDVEIEERDERGLPVQLRMKAPSADIDVRVVLRDVEHDPPSLGPDAFVLEPPRGAVPEYLGP